MGIKRRFIRAIKKEKGKHREFELETPVFDMDEISEISQMDVIYPLEEPFSYARIKYEPELANLVYYVKEPPISDDDRRQIKKIENILEEVLDIDYQGAKKSSKVRSYLHMKIEDLIKKYDIELPEKLLGIYIYYIIRNFAGYSRLDPLMKDPNLEDIHCDGMGVPFYVNHRKFGSIKTNVHFDDQEELNSFVVKLAQWSGRHISIAEPLLDGSLPDGSRVQATYGSDITTRGSTFTIRKFREKPLSPIELIEFGTVDTLSMAYFWVAIENKASVLISGGTATGKTTFLNVLSLFIRPESKIVSIEDTAELNLPHEHWIPAVARAGYGPPGAEGKRYGEINMFDLLKASLRQRPDYIVVGEVRGTEAFVLFQGMATGHAGIATIHADSITSLIQRLTTPPINLSPALLEALDIVIFLTHIKTEDKPSRKVLNVVEVAGLTEEGTIETQDIFKWKMATDTFDFSGRSVTLSKLISTKGVSSIWIADSDVWRQVEQRRDILEWMMREGIREFKEVSYMISDFYRNPNKILKRVYGEKKDN